MADEKHTDDCPVCQAQRAKEDTLELRKFEDTEGKKLVETKGADK